MLLKYFLKIKSNSLIEIDLFSFRDVIFFFNYLVLESKTHGPPVTKYFESWLVSTIPAYLNQVLE